jgi:sigma-B regulation protein RsbU (phosphoserine phosphatase)
VGLVRAHATAGRTPDAIVAAVNHEYCRMLAPLASMLLVRLDPATGLVDYCRAGHPPMVLLRASGELEWLSVGGMLLGIADDARYSSGQVELRPGDVLLACSDGVLEAHDAADEEFGYERLATQLRLAQTRPVEALLFSVLAAVQDFAAPHALIDDTSLVVVRRGAAPR